MNASDIKHKLHSEVFHPNGLRLVAFIKASKTEPGVNPFVHKENVHYLCGSVTVKRPNQAFVSRYIQKEDGTLERRRHWPVDQLQKIDGKSLNSCEFILTFDKEFKFQGESESNKDIFLCELGAMVQRYAVKTPEIVNVNNTVLDAVKKSADSLSGQLHKTKQALSDRGEKLSDVEQATSDMAFSAEKFAESAHKLAQRNAA